MTDYSKMTDEELNDAIAVKRGWSGEFIKDSKGFVVTTSPVGNYTHDWRLAGELLEEMKEEYHDCHLYWNPFTKMWTVQTAFVQQGDYHLFIHSTPQRAICEAWLAWKGAE